MPTNMVSREVESRAVDDFLASVPSGPSALLVEGEAGIGKTTVWLAALQRAHELGFQVLSTRAAQTESVLAYGSLAELLEGLDDAAFAALPPPQRLAIDRVLLRVDADGPMTDQRAVGAAFRSVVERLAEQSPLLVAIDDLQWLDPPSRQIISSAARRLSGPIGVLAAVRDGPDSEHAGSWLELRQPDRVRHARVRPLSLGALHAILFERLGRSFSRPKIRRIQELSGGNPFYALELGRAMDDETWRDGTPLPNTLADLVRARLGSLKVDGRYTLLAAACTATPTVELIARATETEAESTVAILEEAESKGIIQIEGHRVNFTHPLLARGVYTDATPARRRAMHRRLASIVEEPELRARHLALATVEGDEATLESLDAAAEMVRIRGAPAAAAEFLDLAIGLGGGTPDRIIRSAAYLLDAGNPAGARMRLEEMIERLGPGLLRARALHLLAVVRMFGDSFVEAAHLLERAIDECGDNAAAQLPMRVLLAFAHFNGDSAQLALQRADEAVAEASRLKWASLLSQALAMRVMVQFLTGDGLDETDLARALELDADPINVPLAARPRVLQAFAFLWTLQLDEAAEALAAIEKRSIDRGEESELLFLAFHTCQLHVWRADLAQAELVSEETMERALQLGGDLPMCVALMIKAMVGAYKGDVEEARQDTVASLAHGERCGSHRLMEWPVTNLGFLEVSLGNYEAALGVLAPMLAKLEERLTSTEIATAAFVPDAVEAMVGLGRLEGAEKIVDVIEQNGARLDRAWMLAVGARCRCMLLAARGDLEGARSAAERALREHQRLPMPFELARTQLVMGQIQRRQRQRDAAGATLREALAAFEHLGTRLWADRARAEQKRATGTRTGAVELTASEQRVAELAATGVTNREMASALFISPKTVEANLSRIYRKLNIRSRAELGRIMGAADE